MPKQISENTVEYTTEELLESGIIVIKENLIGGDVEEEVVVTGQSN